MPTNKLKQFAELQPLIEKEVNRIVDEKIEAFAQKQKFDVSQVPLHFHNGKDVPNVPNQNVVGFKNLSSVGDGVLSPGRLNEGSLPRIAFWEQTSSADPNRRPEFPVFPLVMISGDNGELTEFAGGEAPDGTILIYKGADFWQLWIYMFGIWKGVDLDLTKL